MFKRNLEITSLILGILVSSCAHKGSSERSISSTTPVSEGSYYQESSYKDGNFAPKKFTPPPMLSESDKMDPFYLRTQADYHYSLGEAYSLEGQAQKAVESFQTVLVYDVDSTGVRTRLAKEYLKLGQINKAIEQVKTVIEKNENNKDARVLLAGLYTTIRSYPQAIEQYEYVLQNFPDFYEANIYLAAVYSETQQFEKAIKLFEKVLAKPEYLNKHLVHYYIGRIYEEQNTVKNFKLIEQNYKKSNELKPDFVDPVIALGALYRGQKQEGKALALYQAFQKAKGPNVKIAEVLSQMFIEQQKFDEAFEQLEILEGQTDDPLAIKVRMALILIEKKMFDRAISKLEEILRIAPESDKIRFYLAAVYEETKKDELSVGHYLKIPPSSPFYGESMVHAGYLLKNIGQLEKAVGVLAKAYENKKDYPQIYAMYASLLDEQKEYQKALEVLASGLVKFPDNAQLHFYYGTIHDRTGDKEKVIDNMKKVIEIDPNHSQGLNYLAFTWAEMNQNMDEAEKLARRAVILDPEDGYILDTLGWILFKRGNKKEALKYLEAAIKFQPTVGVIAEHLGDIYRDLAMTEKAKNMYKKAVDLEVDKQKMRELEEKILAIDRQIIPDRTPASK
ncbi:MAG: tetratricopeptide repeat protein [Bdellovibrionaceae bacterium]|nr:tetratricopeptide repeat protein [Pseudobdellovibrionaceae bacterium]